MSNATHKQPAALAALLAAGLALGQAQRAAIEVDVFDAYGNTVLSPSIRATVIPIEGVTGALRNGYRFSEPAMRRVILKQVRISGRIAKIIDGNHFKV